MSATVELLVLKTTRAGERQHSKAVASHLEDGQQRLNDRVEVGSRLRLRIVVVELSPEQLHAEQRKDDDEEKEQQQQAGDRAHTVDERRHQIAQ